MISNDRNNSNRILDETEITDNGDFMIKVNNTSILDHNITTDQTFHKPTQPNFIIQYENIEVIKNNNKILKNIDLKICENSITAIMGLSGAGKTTLLKSMCGFLDAGKIWIKKEIFLNFQRTMNGKMNKHFKDKYIERNEYVYISSDIMRHVSSLVPQTDSLPFYYTVDEYLKFVTNIFNSQFENKRKNEFNHKNLHVEQIDHKMLEAFNLKHIKKTKIGLQHRGISGGERRRVEIIAELLSDRKILFLDEPTTGLDVKNAIEVIQNLKSLNDSSENGKTVILTIHQPAKELFFSCDYLILIHNGRVLCHLKISEILDFFIKNGFQLSYLTNPAEFIFTDFIDKYKFCKERQMFIREEEQKQYNLDHNIFYNEQIDTLENNDNNSQYNNKKNDSMHASNKKLLFTAHERDRNVPKSNISQCMTQKGKLELYWSQFKILSKRNYIISFTKELLISRLTQAIFTGIICGLLFYNLGAKKQSLESFQSDGNIQIPMTYIQNSKGFLYLNITNTIFNCAYIGLRAESDILVYKELYAFRYNRLVYFISKILFEAISIMIYPIFSISTAFFFLNLDYSLIQFVLLLFTAMFVSVYALTLGNLIQNVFMNPLIASIALPCFLGPMVAISGLMVDNNTTLKIFNLLEYFSIPRYAFNILNRNHFKNEKNEIYSKLLYDDGFFSIKTSLLCILLFILLNCILGYFALISKVRRWWIG